MLWGSGKLNYAKRFEKVLVEMYLTAGITGGTKALSLTGIKAQFRFVDTDAYRELKKNAAKFSKSTIARMKGDVEKKIRDYVKDGSNMRDLSRGIRAQFDDFSGWEADRIARTEISRGVVNGSLSAYGQEGVEYVEYYANAGACPICEASHLEVMTLNEATGLIPQHPNCYCFWLPRPGYRGDKNA